MFKKWRPIEVVEGAAPGHDDFFNVLNFYLSGLIYRRMSADPYQYYVGQQGYRMKPISKADEKNIAMTHCQLSLQTPPRA